MPDLDPKTLRWMADKMDAAQDEAVQRREACAETAARQERGSRRYRFWHARVEAWEEVRQERLSWRRRLRTLATKLEKADG